MILVETSKNLSKDLSQEPTTARPPWASWRSRCSRCMAVVESSPLVGSSSRIRLGLINSSCPILARLRSPPEMPLRKKPPGGQGSVQLSSAEILAS